VTSEERDFWNQCEASKAETESWPAWKQAAAAQARVSPRPELIGSIRQRIDAWPAWKRAAAINGLFASSDLESDSKRSVEMLKERWGAEEETKKYWHAYSDNWEARIEHDGNDGWGWWVSIKDGQCTAEGYVPGSDLEDGEEPLQNDGLVQAKMLVWAVLKQADTWMKVLQ